MPTHPLTPHSFALLPKFVLADDGEDFDAVIHLHFPPFIMTFHEGVGTPVNFNPDDERNLIAFELENGREPAHFMAALMRQAGDYYAEQLRG